MSTIDTMLCKRAVQAVDIDPEASTIDWIKPLVAYGVPALSLGGLGALIDKKNRVRGGLIGLLLGGAAGGGIHYAYNQNIGGMRDKVDTVLNSLALRLGKETDSLRSTRTGVSKNMADLMQTIDEIRPRAGGPALNYDNKSLADSYYTQAALVRDAANTGKQFWGIPEKLSDTRVFHRSLLSKTIK